MFFNATPCPSSVSSYQKNNKPKRCNQALFGLLVVGWLVLSAPLWAQTGSPVDADEEEEESPVPAVVLPRPSSDGSLIVDARAKLAWARCVEGMLWNGHTCTGQPRLLTYAQAQALLKTRNQSEGGGWRLPRVNELRRLVNRSARPPSVDMQLFPAAPRQWHWSSTASVNASAVNPYAYGNVQRGGMGASDLTVRTGWAVDMASGQGEGKVNRNEALVVRLLRPATDSD